MDNILEVKDLFIEFQTHAGRFAAINGASFSVKGGEVLAIVGESGSGKSVLTQSIIKLIPSPPSFIKGGQVLFEDKNLATMTEEELQSIRGKKISVIFQDAMTALNPTMKIEEQISEVIMQHMYYNTRARKKIVKELDNDYKLANVDEKAAVVLNWLTEHFRLNSEKISEYATKIEGHLKSGKLAEIEEWIKTTGNITRASARQMTLELLNMVKIPDAEKRMNQYIFQFSGGMRQRIMIAMALACRPKLLIADEPTTALDVTIKTEVLDLLIDLVHELGTSIILITHDLGIVASYANRINVMYAGDFVETGTAHEIFYNPKHPYTRGLLNAIPRLDYETQDDLKTIDGQPPSLFVERKGCPFANRCEYCMQICKETQPPETALSETHKVRCYLLDPRAKAVAEKFNY